MDEETQKIIDLAKQAADEMQYEYARAQAAIAQAQAMTVIAEALLAIEEWLSDESMINERIASALEQISAQH